MRLLKAQNTNLRTIYGRGVQFDSADQVFMESTNSIRVPKGTTAQRPANPENGHLRYNTTDNRFEAYEAGQWDGIKSAAPSTYAPITQQNLGNGDASITIFGPLNSGDSFYPVPAAAVNVLVLVENVFQISTTNYTLEQNPSSTGTGQETNAGSFVTSTEYIITSAGDTDFTAIGAADSNVGTIFTATGAGSGTGKARQTGYYLEFTSAPDLNKPVTAIHNFDK